MNVFLGANERGRTSRELAAMRGASHAAIERRRDARRLLDLAPERSHASALVALAQRRAEAGTQLETINRALCATGSRTIRACCCSARTSARPTAARSK